MPNNYIYDPSNDPGYYTGELSATSIVDQTDTYMAFVQNSGRSEPEIIQSNKYRILTLIDENGEVYSPNDEDVVVSSIIKNIFGRGKKIQVRVVSNAEQANLNFPSFYGTHTSMGPGYFQNILVTTYGTGAGDFVQTMSFANAYSQDFIAENLNKKWGTNISFLAGNIPLSTSTWITASYMFSNVLNNTPNFNTGGLANDWNVNTYKLINYSTDTANTRFRVRVNMPFSKRRFDNNVAGTFNAPNVRIKWRVYNITQNQVLYVSDWTTIFSAGDGVAYQAIKEYSSYLNMNQNDEFQIEWLYDRDSAISGQTAGIPWFDLRESPDECWYQFEPEFPAQSTVSQIMYQDGINSWNTPYITTVLNITGSFTSSNGDVYGPNSTLLLFSPTASGMFNSFQQQLPTASEAFGYGGVEVIPFNQIRAGDFIQFGYWNFPYPNVNLRFIEKVLSYGSQIGLYVTPQLVNTGSAFPGLPILVGTGSQFPTGSINNFNIYRIDENNDTAIVNLYIENMYPAKGPFNYLNPTTNASPTMILFPENASQKLKDNYNSIIKRLTTEGIIY